MQSIALDLWFDTNAEEAVDFYTSVFPDSKIIRTIHYGPDAPGPGREGQVMYVQFEVKNLLIGAINGGPLFTFNEAASLVVNCDDQDEIDRYWEALSAVPEAEQCGWLKDKFGVSWQIVPSAWSAMIDQCDQTQLNRAMTAMYGMKKLDIAALEHAAGIG